MCIYPFTCVNSLADRYRICYCVGLALNLATSLTIFSHTPIKIKALVVRISLFFSVGPSWKGGRRTIFCLYKFIICSVIFQKKLVTMLHSIQSILFTCAMCLRANVLLDALVSPYIQKKKNFKYCLILSFPQLCL